MYFNPFDLLDSLFQHDAGEADTLHQPSEDDVQAHYIDGDELSHVHESPVVSSF